MTFIVLLHSARQEGIDIEMFHAAVEISHELWAWAPENGTANGNETAAFGSLT
jgi:hypothetical protein